MSGGTISMFSVGESALLCGLVVFATALTVGVLLTPLMCRVAWRLGALDKPDGFLKNHHRATPTLGGVPFFIAMFSGISLLYIVYHDLSIASLLRHGWSVSFTGIGLALFLTLLLGIRDDLFHVNPLPKMMFQVVAAAMIVGSGLIIRRCDFFGEFELSLGALAAPFTLFWLVGSCNAFNFIDGMDGLASGVGVIISMALAVLGFVSGAFGPALVALALAGGLSAVWLFNIRPARIFLGDSGSQVIGLLLGALAVGIGTHNGVFALPSMGLILSVPIMDAFLSILRRYSQSDSPARGDHRHVHHCLQQHGFSVNMSVALICIFTAWSAMLGILFRFSAGTFVGMAALLFVAVELYLGVRLGCLNMQRLYSRVTEPVETESSASNAAANKAHQPYLMELDVLWERMKPTFEQLDLDRAILTLEGLNDEGSKDCEIFQWTRSEDVITDLLGNRWTKRFSLDGDERHIAVLRLEAAQRAASGEERIEWLLNEIRKNMSGLAIAPPTKMTGSEKETDATVPIHVA